MPLLFAASGVDAGIIVGLHALGGRFFGGPGWIQNLSGRKVLFSVATGLVAGTAIEAVALSCRWWEYRKRMPLLPPFGVGMLPVLQMTVLPLLAFWLASRRQDQRPYHAGSKAQPR